MQYLSRKCLPEKSCLHCLRILVMSWLFKDPVVIMKEIMSWLFKDPINSGLAQFDHVQFRCAPFSKMCAIFGTKTAHLSWTKFFGINHCYYFHLPTGPFHCAKFKKLLTTDAELRQCTIFGPKVVHFSQTFFLWKIITIILIYLLAPFIVQNLGPKMAHFPK